MAVSPSPATRRKRARQQRIGRVTIYSRGQTWHVYYLENGQRIRRKIGPSLSDAKQLASQINGQLRSGRPSRAAFPARSELSFDRFAALGALP